MFSVLTLFFLRKSIDDSFIRRVTDNSFRKIIQHDKSGFIIFHHIEQLVSDTGYLRFVEVARKYKNVTNFYLAVTASGSQLAHDFKIDGFPSLFYMANHTYPIEMFGSFTFNNIDKFISKFTNNTIPEIEFLPENVTVDNLYPHVKLDDFDDSQYVFIVADDKTKFGRTALQLAKQLKNEFKFVRITKKLPSLKNIRFPSILYIGKEDNIPHIYTGDPIFENMLKWINSIPKPKVSRLAISDLFSKDGSTKKTVIKFSNMSNVFDILPSMVKTAITYPTIKFSYADPIEYTKYFELFGLKETPTSNLCIESNYQIFRFNECENIDDFYQNRIQLKHVKVPEETYEYVAKVNEIGFRSFIEKVPVFLLFTGPNNLLCKDMEDASQEAAKRIAQFGGKVNWLFWDVYNNIPTFKNKINIKIPSLWYFESTNYSSATKYEGNNDFLSIVEWAHFQKSDFDLAGFLSKESGADDEQINSL